MADTWTPKKLNITECVLAYTGPGPKGEFQIFNLKATNEQGQAITEKLASFSELPLGPGDFEVTPYRKNGALKNYTVRKVGGSGGTKVDVGLLTQRVDWCESEINGLKTLVNQLIGRPVAAPSPSTPAYAPIAHDDDDIPF